MVLLLDQQQQLLLTLILQSTIWFLSAQNGTQLRGSPLVQKLATAKLLLLPLLPELGMVVLLTQVTQLQLIRKLRISGVYVSV